MDIWKHIKLSGYFCTLKHRSYQWPAKINNNNTLISDSICKYSRTLHDTFVQAYPGANIKSIIFKIRIGKVRINDYKIIILHLGTNDLHSRNPDAILNDMRTLFHLIRRKNPEGTIVLSQIIHRPIDLVLTEQDRLKVNKGYQKFA